MCRLGLFGKMKIQSFYIRIVFRNRVPLSRDEDISPVNFRGAWRVANIFARAFRERGVDIPVDGGKLMYAEFADASSYLREEGRDRPRMFRFFFFSDSPPNTRSAIGTRIYSRARAPLSQLVARPFIFHVARDRSSLNFGPVWSLETDRNLHPSSIHRGNCRRGSAPARVGGK